MNHQRLLGLVYPFVPFLRWLPELRNSATLRADLIAGLTVALVLIPQSMAYAQLAGLPAYYGLYAAFLPPMVAALFGSSRQLATGPVAVVSLLTAAALEPIATAGGGAYIAYAVMLALLVGLFQVALGLLRMGVLVNFLSHPVVLGFTNAAAIIIATSQLSKIFGVSVEKAAQHYETIWATLVAAATDTHWPTFGMAALAFLIMIALRRINPRLPNVLIAVVITTVVSWALGFEKSQKASSKQLAETAMRDLVATQLKWREQVAQLTDRAAQAEKKALETAERFGVNSIRTLSARQEVDKIKLRTQQRSALLKDGFNKLKSARFEYVPDKEAAPGRFYFAGGVPEGLKTDGYVWHITALDRDSTMTLHAGGSVVGAIPEGIPEIRVPTLDARVFGHLALAAITIALIGFMEAISIAKAMAARTRQKLDVNQELVGQGIANIVGSFSQSYAISGSFSRSAVNISAGALTGFSSVVTSLVVLVALLWLTPLLYHLPQATLAAVIMMAVIGLVNIKAIRHIWKVKQSDGVVAVITFVLTLAFAPHLENAIVVGVVLSLGIFLYKTMKPRVVLLSRHPDGSLRDAELFNLATCENVALIRFDGALYFANTSYFEEVVMKYSAQMNELKYIIVDGQGINMIDATGEEMLAEVTERLEKAGVRVLFTQFKKQVMDVFWHSGFLDHVGKDRFFSRSERALDFVWKELGNDHEVDCPLNTVCLLEKPEASPVESRLGGLRGLFGR